MDEKQDPGTGAGDMATHATRWSIDKFRDPDGRIAAMLQAGATIDEAIARCTEYLGHEDIENNVLLNEGIAYAWDILIADDTDVTKDRWNSTNARIGVGSSSAGEDPAQTGLQGASKTFVGMDGTYPSRASQTVSWRSTFGPAVGNHDWKEFTVVNAADDTGQNLNRKVTDKGTKAGDTWVVTVAITLS